MLWFYYALIGSIIFAAQELLMRVLSVRTGAPRLFAIAFNLWGALFAIVLFIIQGGSFSTLSTLSATQILLVILAAACYGFYERYQFFARRGMDAATFSIVIRINTVIGFIGAIIFLHEPLTLMKSIGLLLIIAASLLLVYKNPKFTYSPAFTFAILCSIALGATSVLDKPASAGLPGTLYSFIVWVTPIFIIAFPKVTKKEIIKELHIGGWKVALAALLNVAGYIIYLHALTLAEASRVNPIVATSGIITVLGGIYILKERDHLWRKIIAGVIACIGVILLK